MSVLVHAYMEGNTIYLVMGFTNPEEAVEVFMGMNTQVADEGKLVIEMELDAPGDAERRPA